MPIRTYTVTIAVVTLACATGPSTSTSTSASQSADVVVSVSPASRTITTTSPNPVADAFRDNAKSEARNLIAAAEEFPADKYAFKPTPAQMSFADVVVHLSEGNDYLCGAIAGQQAPARSKVVATDSKDAMIARLKETFAFCDQALAALDDSKLSEQLPFFGGRTRTRASIMTLTTADWADHYSQSAIYMRLNGILPPTAKRPAM